jgi:hypothetical protein
MMVRNILVTRSFAYYNLITFKDDVEMLTNKPTYGSDMVLS